MVAEDGVVDEAVAWGARTPGVTAVTVAEIMLPGFRLLKVTVVGPGAVMVCFAPLERVMM